MTGSLNSSETRGSPSGTVSPDALAGFSLQEKLELLKELETRKEKGWADRQEIIQRAISTQTVTREGVEAYAYLLLRTDTGDPVTAAPHHSLWLDLMCDTRIKQLLIVAPPESAKTTWIISAFCGLHVGVFPEYPVLIGSVTSEVAERRSVSLRAMVMSEPWQRLFPNIRPVKGTEGLTWETHQWSVAPHGTPYPGRIHPTVASAGMLGTVIGSRARLVIGDDLLDYDSTRTVVQRENTKNWAHSSFFSREMAQVGRKLLIGNAWHYQDMYATLREEGGWVVCHTPMLSRGKEVYSFITYPDGWPHPMLGEALAGDPYEVAAA